MKKLIIFLLGFIGALITILPLAKADPLNQVPAWYCTISGNAGAFKISFHATHLYPG